MSTDDQQKRGGLVPIGKVAVRLPGIEGRGRAMSARARQHFTLLKQVNQLIEAAEGETSTPSGPTPPLRTQSPHPCRRRPRPPRGW